VSHLQSVSVLVRHHRSENEGEEIRASAIQRDYSRRGKAVTSDPLRGAGKRGGKSERVIARRGNYHPHVKGEKGSRGRHEKRAS